MPTIQLPIEIITPKQLYLPAHKCIYCGATPPRLNEEHIVPFAIAGDLAVLPESSCDCCTNINRPLRTEMLCATCWRASRLGCPPARAAQSAEPCFRFIRPRAATDRNIWQRFAAALPGIHFPGSGSSLRASRWRECRREHIVPLCSGRGG